MMKVVGRAIKDSSKLSEVDRKRIVLAVELFNNWDYHFDVDSKAAALMAAWEHAMAGLMHETKIKGERAR